MTFDWEIGLNLEESDDTLMPKPGLNASTKFCLLFCLALSRANTKQMHEIHVGW